MKILIVEDNPSIGELLQETMQEAGYQVAGMAVSANEAYSMARESQPDLILLDIELEGDIDGIDAAKELKSIINAPFIFLTGNDNPDYVKRAKALGPASFLYKPYRGHELLANIEIALDKSEELNELEDKSFLDSEEFLKHFGQSLKEYRKVMGFSQSLAAEKLQINYRHYQNIEGGKINLKMDTFVKLLNFSKIRFSDLKNKCL